MKQKLAENKDNETYNNINITGYWFTTLKKNKLTSGMPQ